MPEYFMRFYTKGRTTGTTFDYFVPVQDMPNEPNQRGDDLFEDIHVTPGGNTFLYQKAKIRAWHLDFQDITTNTKNAIEQVCHGFFKLQQMTVLFFGTALNSTASLGSLASTGQMWGTTYMRLDGYPRETAYDLWSLGVNIKEFGPDQLFT